MKKTTLLILLLFLGYGLKADIFIVTTTNDYGPGSLREAIKKANKNPGEDVILFNIPSDDQGFSGSLGTVNAFVICPKSKLPVIKEALTINGSSQTFYTGDSNMDGAEIIICYDVGEDKMTKGVATVNIRYVEIVGSGQM